MCTRVRVCVCVCYREKKKVLVKHTHTRMNSAVSSLPLPLPSSSSCRRASGGPPRLRSRAPPPSTHPRSCAREVGARVTPRCSSTAAPWHARSRVFSPSSSSLSPPHPAARVSGCRVVSIALLTHHNPSSLVCSCWVCVHVCLCVCVCACLGLLQLPFSHPRQDTTPIGEPRRVAAHPLPPSPPPSSLAAPRVAPSTSGREDASVHRRPRLHFTA